MDLNNMLNQYLGKQTRISQRDNGDGTKEVCDLDTGEITKEENIYNKTTTSLTK